MGRKRQHGHQKRHGYGGDTKSHAKGNGGNGSAKGGHFEPRYLTLAEGQKSPENQKLLQERFTRLTVIIYGARLSGAGEFETTGDPSTFRPSNDQDPLETFGNFSAGNLIEDMFYAGFVCTGVKFRSRDEAEFGDEQGKNYLYFQRRGDIRPDRKTGKIYYLRPHWADYVILQADLQRLQIFKAQLFLTANARGGTKHTMKLFSGAPRRGNIEKPVWKPISRCWVFELVQNPGQQPAQRNATSQTHAA